MTDREKQLLIMLKESDLNNIKIILQIQVLKLSYTETTFYLDKILKIQEEINKIKNKTIE